MEHIIEDGTILHHDAVFAPLDDDHTVRRIAGGNETEVYASDDGRRVIKLKSELGGVKQVAVAHARIMRLAAEEFSACLGSDHTVPNDYVVARDASGRVQVLVVQPYVASSSALHDLEYDTLSPEERMRIAEQLRGIIDRSIQFYRATGRMPDLYGRSSSSPAERARLKRPHMLPYRLWSFLVQRNLLRSHNLMVSRDDSRRIVLVDYDLVRRGWLYRRVYFAVRSVLFWRDRILIWWMQRGGGVPRWP